MDSLLHIDASIRTVEEGSVSRQLSAVFAQRWRETHPEGGYTYRDFRVDPLPHITFPEREHLFDPEGADHGTTPEQRELNARVLAEVRAATVILFGMPMYNYTVPSTVKAWIDRVIVPGHMIMPGQDSGLLSGKKVYIATARGGSYAPGTPREGYDFQEPYVRKALGSIGLTDVTMVHAEMTFAETVPALAQFKPIAVKTRAEAHETLHKSAGE